MPAGVEYIGRREIAWSYLATFFMIGAGVLLLPFVLNKMSAEMVGIWNIFQTITFFVLILDFGFRPTFARNISYVLSGAKHLQKDGVEQIIGCDTEVDYTLLKATILAMRRFYRWLSLGVFAILVTAGSAYFCFLLQKYNGNHIDAIIAWILLVCINCYNLYTFYYDALLLGKGYVKRSQQITILGQIVYLAIAIGLIYCGWGLSAIVAAQVVATVVRRVLMYRVFFTTEMREKLRAITAGDPTKVLSAIYPNALKVGLTQLGGFCVNKSAILIGSAFLTLEQVACYGITIQVMDVFARCANVYCQSMSPKLAQYRMEHNLRSLRKAYIYNVVSVLLTFIIGGVGWIMLGNWVLGVIHSQTTFVPMSMLVVLLCINFLEQNHATAAGFIMADNRIPFFIPSLLSGAATILMLYLFLGPLHWGMWGMILAPGIVQAVYQNWKWPSVVIREILHK